MSSKVLTIGFIILSTTPAYAGTVTTDGDDFVISTKDGLKIYSQDKSKSFQLGGRLQWDYDATDSDNADKTNDFDVRRARIYTKGHFEDWAFKAQFNIAESDESDDGGTAEDLYIRYTGLGKAANITVGKQKEPFGLEELTSSKDITALERSAMTEFYAAGRNAGIQLHGKGSNWTYGVGAFEAGGDGSDDFDNVAFTARGTFVPWQSENNLMHLGVGITSRDGETSADEVDNFNLELAGAWQAFHGQVEYFDGESGDEDFDGYYVQLGWVITGENRPYRDGVFKRIKPKGPAGAWEAVIRYEDGDGKYSDIGLGSGNGEQMTLGVNYYVNNYVRFGLSYMDGEQDTGDTTLEGDEVRARIQLVY